MNAHHRARGFTLTEMLVVVLILVFLLAMLMPGLNQSRDRGRRATCINHLRQIGLAFHLHHDAYRKLPPASGVTRAKKGQITAVDGWSFLVYLLPYMEYGSIYDTLDVNTGRPLSEPDGSDAAPHATVRATVIDEWICPQYEGDRYADPRTKADAITNFKAMGATHHESLSVASADPALPKYDPQGKHPDGACYPGSKLAFKDFARDGTAHTILVAETVEPRFARWTVGAEATLVGLPRVVQYERYEDRHFAPHGFDGQFDQRSALASEYRTYLGWDYDVEPYDGEDGSVGGRYGPSSHHPGVVNHLFADGTVRTIHTEVDTATYMFLITRAGGDPTGQFYDRD